jgi:hypothetical protein
MLACSDLHELMAMGRPREGESLVVAARVFDATRRSTVVDAACKRRAERGALDCRFARCLSRLRRGPFFLNDAEAGNIAARGELPAPERTECGCRFVGLYMLN